VDKKWDIYRDIVSLSCNRVMPSEAQARITINKLLEEAGWRFLPDAQGTPAA
jgi:hypothetical protein